MEHDYIENNQIIDRYLQGDLSADEADRFTIHSIGCQQCISQLQIAERMQRGLRGLYEENPDHFLDTPSTPNLRKKGEKQPLFWLGLVAAVLLGAWALWLWSSQGHSQDALNRALEKIALLETEQQALNAKLARFYETPSLGEPWANLPVLRLDPLRSGQSLDRAPSYEIVLENDKPFLILNLLVPKDLAGPFEANFTHANQDLIWTENFLEPDVHGQVVIGFPMNLLPPGDYQVQLFPKGQSDATGLVTTYTFRIIKEP